MSADCVTSNLPLAIVSLLPSVMSALNQYDLRLELLLTYPAVVILTTT